jgi:hypothetical protein
MIAICVLLFGFILPADKRLEELKTDISSTEKRIQDRKNAASLLQSKLASLRQAQAARKDKLTRLEKELHAWQEELGSTTQFSLPETGPFPRSPDMLPGAVSAKAADSGLTDIEARLLTPHPGQAAHTVGVRVSGTGSSVSDLRTFVRTLLETPYIASIDQLELRTCRDGLCVDLKLSVPLSYE